MRNVRFRLIALFAVLAAVLLFALSSVLMTEATEAAFDELVTTAQPAVVPDLLGTGSGPPTDFGSHQSLADYLDSANIMAQDLITRNGLANVLDPGGGSESLVIALSFDDVTALDRGGGSFFMTSEDDELSDYTGELTLWTLLRGNGGTYVDSPPQMLLGDELVLNDQGAQYRLRQATDGQDFIRLALISPTDFHLADREVTRASNTGVTVGADYTDEIVTGVNNGTLFGAWDHGGTFASLTNSYFTGENSSWILLTRLAGHLPLLH